LQAPSCPLLTCIAAGESPRAAAEVQAASHFRFFGMNRVGTRRIGKAELLQWAEALSGLPCPRLEDLRSGIVLAKLMQTVFPKLRRGNLKWNPKFDWEVNFNWDAIGNMAQVLARLRRRTQRRLHSQAGPPS